MHAALAGEIWNRPGLSLENRELATVAMVIAAGNFDGSEASASVMRPRDPSALPVTPLLAKRIHDRRGVQPFIDAADSACEAAA
jgi:hypothetical protein